MNLIAARVMNLEQHRPALEKILQTRLSVTPDGSSYRIKKTISGTHWIDVSRMIVNWRLVTTRVNEDTGWDRGWCYAGSDMPAFISAALAALAWDGAEDTEPPGFLKRLQRAPVQQEGEEETAYHSW